MFSQLLMWSTLIFTSQHPVLPATPRADLAPRDWNLQTLFHDGFDEFQAQFSERPFAATRIAEEPTLKRRVY